jgi:MATE family multidrug resistance protein
MNTPTQREELRWKLKPFPELVRLAWPITVSMLSYSVMTLVDTLFAGRLGAPALGAVGLGGVVTFTLLSFGVGLLRGSKVIIAQAVGASKLERVKGSVGAALIAAVTLGVATATFGQLVALELPRLSDASVAARLSQRYLAIRLLGAPLVLVAFAIREIRCALGDPRSPMRAALVANAVHVPLNATLIFSARLGVTGAALSTVLAQGLEAWLLVLVQRQDGFGLACWTRHDLRDLWQTGWPLGLERLLNIASFTVLVTLVARASDTDLAAHQIAHQVTLFALLPMMAIAEAAAVLAGQAVGAGEDRLVRRVARSAAGAGTAYGALCAMVYVVFGPLIVHSLTSDPQVCRITVRLLWIGAAWQAFAALYFVGGAVLRGAGDVRFTTTATVVIAWIVTPPLAVLLGTKLGLGAVGGWLALLAEWAAGALVLWARVEGRSWLVAAAQSRARLARADTRLLVAEPASG